MVLDHVAEQVVHPAVAVELGVERGREKIALPDRDHPTATARRTAFLGGSLRPDIHDLVYSIARNTKGMFRVECSIRDRGRRRTPETHPHHEGMAALPPPPPSTVRTGSQVVPAHQRPM